MTLFFFLLQPHDKCFSKMNGFGANWWRCLGSDEQKEGTLPLYFFLCTRLKRCLRTDAFGLHKTLVLSVSSVWRGETFAARSNERKGEDFNCLISDSERAAKTKARMYTIVYAEGRKAASPQIDFFVWVYELWKSLVHATNRRPRSE